MAPPNTKRKISRNMTPWIVPSTTSWGVRMNLSSARLATTSVLVVRVAGRELGMSVVAIVSDPFSSRWWSGAGAGGGLGSASLGGAVDGFLFQGLAGQR